MFVKGQSGNPNGRPKNAEIDMLRTALNKQGKKLNVDFWDEVAKQAFKNPTIMLAVIKKFVPDLSSQELKHSGELDINLLADKIQEARLRVDPSNRIFN